MVRMKQVGWVVCAVTLTFLISKSLASTCQSTKRGNVDVFNCSRAELDSLPELPKEAQVLDFGMNKFTTFPEIPESPSCHLACGVKDSSSLCRLAISFSNNNIKGFDKGALHGLKCLQTLDLSYNDIKAEIFRPESFEEGVYYLERLNLRGNPLGQLPDNVITHPFMRFLRHLDLSSCELTEMGKDSVDDLRDLMILDLSDNKLSSIHADTFKGLKKLEQLDLSDNQLTFFSEHVFGDLENLEDLRLKGNRIKGFHDNAFYEDSGLLNLDLTDNGLKDIPYPAINKLLKLKTLVLSKNPIQKVASDAKPNNVRNLVMDNMPLLQELGADDLKAFSNLESLTISGSRGFRKIHGGALTRHAPNLRQVRLENNWLATLESDALPWQQLESLVLDGNPWLCDDRLRWMIIADCIKGPVICAGPGNLRGQDLKTLEGKNLKREVGIFPMASIILSLLAIPALGACAVFVWRRRRFCIGSRELQGRYVTVFTRDSREDDEIRVDVRLRENANRILAVSNGSADDTKHLVKLEKNGGSNVAADDTEEEEI